jgi:GNAT superfamily N-acetyltransferase
MSRSPVRWGTREDVARFVELGLRFYAGEGGREASPQTLAHFAFSHLDDKDRAFLVAGKPVGAVLCGAIAPHYLTGEPTAFKTAWYALPTARGHGASLLRAFERWARERGAKRLFVAGRNGRTLTMLTRLGFTPLETVHEKDLQWQKQRSQSS